MWMRAHQSKLVRIIIGHHNHDDGHRVDVDCGRVPAILKGEVSYINGTTYLASQIVYECTPGNRIAGHRVRFCGPDGRWTGGSPKCEEVRCDAPELPANGSAIYIGNDRSFKEQSFSVGVTVQYECDYGHVVKGSWSSRLCQANGEWSGEPPVCKFVDCGQAPSIENGNYLLKHPPAGASIGTATPIELSRRSDGGGGGGGGGGNSGPGAVGTFTYYGTIAHYSCEPNYKLQGPAQRECLESGLWRTPLPTCEPIQCPKPEFFDEYTQVSLAPKGSGGVDGSESNQQQLKAIKLIANNQWLSNHQVNNLSYNVGDKLLYSCVPGYELYGGPEVRTCTQYAQWSGSSTPRCRLIDCGRPAPIGQEGRFYLLNESTTFNSIVEYSCVRPFKLVEVKIRQAGNLIETLMNAQAGVTQILTALPIGVKVCANNGQWMPNDQQPKCTTGAGGQFDGVDNTLDGSARQVHVAGSNSGSGHPSFININAPGSNNNGNQDGDASNSFADGASSGGQQANGGSQSAYFWAKVLLVISLPLMFAIITVTLICIRSKKRPKQASTTMHRASILTSSGQRAAAAAATMQIQLANSKGLQQQASVQQQSLLAAAHANGHSNHPLTHNHHHPHHQVAGLIPGQNVYMGNTGAGMQKIFPGSMVGQSQMSSNGGLPPAMQPAYGTDAVLALGQDGNAGRAMVAFTGPMLMNGKSSSLGMVVASNQRATRSDHHPGLDSYSRLSIESEANNQAGNKTIRHNPNGLVTFVSPAQQQKAQQQQHQQQHQQQQQQKGANSSQQQQQQHQQVSSSASTSSTSSGVSSSSHQHHPHNQHQISPQSISTSLSVSSSSSPSSSNSSSANHTAATRLGGDSSSSPSNSIQDGVVGGHHRAHHHQQNHHLASEYEAPQPFNQQVPGQPPANPPSLPAHPPPPHRVQQQFKQLMKHQSTASPTTNAKQATRGVSSASSAASDVASKKQQQQQQQQAAILAQNGKNGGPLNGDHHYMEPGV